VTPSKPPAELLSAARAWRDQDPDHETVAELDQIIEDAEAGLPAATADLADRFAAPLTFGTAGLRGALGAGPNRMNRVVVAQAAAGLAGYLLARDRRPSVVIGYDGRRNSRVFAEDTAELVAGAGVRAILLPRLLPTPVLAFAVRHLDVSAGVMVTASHNPANDNGYKVYLGGLDHGSQIVPPVDALIAAEIARVAAAGPVAELPRSKDYQIADDSVTEAYVRATVRLVGPAAKPLVFAYTPMHGVGWDTARRVFAEAGFDEPHVVSQQLEPDPTFPTVAFPNPEEPGAMDLLLAVAEEANADLAIANDPDADRLAVGIPTRDGWRLMTGNEVGSILGWRAAERTTDGRDDTGTLAASLVSSPALREIARKFNLDFQDTLTGFKWISRVGGLIFGYEEALGYLVDPEKVRDKDGISAAVDLLALAAELKADGKTMEDHLLAFAEKFGGYASAQISLRVDRLAEIGRMMTALRQHPPAEVGGVPVEQIDDFRDGFGQFGPNDILRIWVEGGGRIVVRPSGTEPKLKAYIDAASTEGTGRERLEAAEAAVATLERGMRKILRTKPVE
jgi:phosphomannomutase